MKQPGLTKADAALLRAQVIDADRPGTILRDFQTVLDFIGTGGVKAAGKNNLLPIDAVPVLDPKLARPLRLELTMKRPQLKSHPYLHGLHLLLRATGLTGVEGSGDKARLIVDPIVLDVWNSLNPTEKYFSLLEGWLVVGRPEMIGERDNWLGRDYLMDCLSAWGHVPGRGRPFNLSRPQEERLFGIGRNLFHVALMDLFGLLEVELPSSPVKPWCPAAIKHQPFGDAVFTLLWQSSFGSDNLDLLLHHNGNDEDGRFGRLQPIFQPYFPAWQKVFVLPEPEAKDGVFVFRVSLGKVWRQIAIPADLSLDDLVGAILDCFDFDSDHLYEFTYRDRFGGLARALHPYCDEGPFGDEVRVGEVPLNPGQSMKLVYDFGDNWQFDVKLERIDPPNKRLKKPRVLEKHGKAPEQYPRWD
ncbi:MAG: plasmid pRiA4b ORF-3 family protein [Planctomycetes bacterium]|nr:plasmid pRiA4b ORF-3 family protein [Planctomycetota bacterium]